MSQNLTQDEQAEINEFGLDSKNVRPQTLQKVLASPPLSTLPDSLTQTATGQIVSKIGDTVDNLFYGSFAIPGTNWGGPLYSAGKTFAKNQIITPQDLKVEATNKADSLYQLHDIEYQESATKPTLDERIDALKDADRKFIDRAQDVLRREGLSLYEKFLLHSSILAFKAKLNTGIGYESGAQYRITNPDAFKAGDIAFFRNSPIYNDKYLRVIKNENNKLPSTVTEELSLLPKFNSRKAFINDFDIEIN